MDELWTCHLGQVPYAEALALQEQLRERVRDRELPDVLLVLEHPPVYTLGRRSRPGDLPMGEAWCRERGIDVVPTERGGKLTYHGPGQLVAYPIVHVTDLPGYVAALERAIVAALAEAGVEAATREGRAYTGVWVGERKIASIGIHVSRGVSMHGLAINVENDLAPFETVVACGLPDVRMTSVAREGSPERVPCLRKRLAHALARELGLRQRLVTPRRLVPAAVPA
jgi:lipoate-protein ligase B